MPFYLRTGKRMSDRRTEIVIQYRASPYRLFEGGDASAGTPNIVRLLVDPEHGLESHFDAKAPGPEMRLARVSATMRYQDYFPEASSVGYETLLYDCMQGDAALFQRADAVEASWAVVQRVLDAWAEGGAPETYVSGSAGPAAADALLARDGHRWQPLAQDQRGRS